MIRADGTTGAFGAGDDLTLGAGDTLLLRSDTPFAADNPGDTPVEFLQEILAFPANFPRGTATLAGWDEHYYDVRDVPIRGGAMSMKLQRLSLAPKAILASPPDVLRMWITYPTYVEGRPVQNHLATRYDGSHLNIDDEPITVYTLDLEPVGFDALTP